MINLSNLYICKYAVLRSYIYQDSRGQLSIFIVLRTTELLDLAVDP